MHVEGTLDPHPQVRVAQRDGVHGVQFRFDFVEELFLIRLGLAPVVPVEALQGQEYRDGPDDGGRRPWGSDAISFISRFDSHGGVEGTLLETRDDRDLMFDLAQVPVGASEEEAAPLHLRRRFPHSELEEETLHRRGVFVPEA